MSNQNFSYIPSIKSINPEDYTITPFKVFKKWDILNSNELELGIKTYQALYPDSSRFKGNIIHYSSSKYTPIYNNDLEMGATWYYLDNHYRDNYKDFVIDNELEINIYQTASLMTIPINIIGEKIKPGTYNLTSSLINLEDDGKGNLLDSNYPSGSIIDSNYLVSYWGFNEKFNYGNNRNEYNSIVKSNKEFLNLSINGNVSFSEGILTSDLQSGSGKKCDFLGNGYLRVENHKDINFENDFSLSFWIHSPVSQSVISNDENHIFSKRKRGKELNFNNFEKKVSNEEKDLNVSGWPYDISIYNQNTSDSGKIKFSRKGGTQETIITSSIPITGSQNHIIIQKTGSLIELYVNGVIDSSGSDLVNGRTSNNADLFIGSLDETNNYFSGSLDEIRFYNKALSETEIDYLGDNNYFSGSAYQNNKIGNVFYSEGNILISNPEPRYNNVFDNYTGSFKNSYSIYEHEIVCKINKKDFNMTMNPTIRQNDSEESIIAKDFVTGSFFTPYITTIGLYNDKHELMAIAKCAKPIPKRSDVPINFLIRFDV